MIIYHADDYGINIKQSKRILECHEKGILNSCSVVPNSPQLKECMDILDENMLVSVHINFVEGICCADPKTIPLLVDREGKFKVSYCKMMWLSIIKPFTLRKQIRQECISQIKRVCQYIKPGEQLRIDSHMHYHMIPVVFRGLCDACKDIDIDVEYIRWPLEPFQPFLAHKEIWKKISWVNIVKSILLHIFGLINYPALVRAGLKKKRAIFFGIMFTGKMYYETVSYLLDDFIELARTKSMDLEVLFHPGAIYDGEIYLDTKYKEFYQMKNRMLEGETLLRLNRYKDED